MPYLCNLDYAVFGVLEAPLFRTHTCSADGDYCDFSMKRGAPVMKAWPPVFTQGKFTASTSVKKRPFSAKAENGLLAKDCNIYKMKVIVIYANQPIDAAIN